MFTVLVDAAEINNKAGGYIAARLTALIGKNRYSMKGTEGRRKRCTALIGTVGQSVTCSIYAGRPTSCRMFLAAWELNTINPKCDLARESYGMFAFSAF
jgi:Fe-S-cluster containining protein